MLTLDDMERKFYQEKYAPGLSTGQVVERENFVNNPNVEVNLTDIIPAGVGITLTRDTVEKYNGTASCRVDCDGSAASQGVQFVRGPSGSPSFSSGVYSASIMVKGTAGVQVYGNLRFSGGPGPMTDAAAPALTLDGTWQLIIINNINVSRSDYTTVSMMIRKSSASIATFYADCALIEKSSSVGAYFDGDTADFNNGNYVWSGTPHASTSKLIVPEPVIAENLLPFRTELAEWNAANNNGTLTPSEDGTGLRFTWNGVGTYGLCQNSTKHVYRRKIGSTLYMIGEARSKLGDFRVQVAEIGINGESLGNTSNTLPNGTLSPTQWTPFKIPFVIGSDPTAYRTSTVQIITVPEPDNWFEFRNLSIVEDAPNSGSFNGDSPNAYWTGTPNNSSSRLIDVNSRDQGYLERAYWANRSGLTPKENYSYSDHKFAYLRAQGFTGTIADMDFQRFGGDEYNYYKTQLGL